MRPASGSRARTWSSGRRTKIEVPVTHIPVRVDDDAVRWDVVHTLVVATQTVASPDLIGRLKARAAEKPHRYTIICPRSGDLSREEVCERLARTLAELYRADIDATGQPMSPEPLAAIQNAIDHYRIDEILISTLAGQQSKWLEEGLIDQVREITDKPVEHYEARRPARPTGWRGEARRGGEPDGERLGRRRPRRARAPRPARGPQSSRIDRQTLGILLFIISEVMLFGAFFASYFFLRVVANDGPWPPEGVRAPGLGRRRQHRDPGLLELHRPLGARGDPQGQPPRRCRWASR